MHTYCFISICSWILQLSLPDFWFCSFGWKSKKYAFEVFSVTETGLRPGGLPWRMLPLHCRRVCILCWTGGMSTPCKSVAMCDVVWASSSLVALFVTENGVSNNYCRIHVTLHNSHTESVIPTVTTFGDDIAKEVMNS